MKHDALIQETRWSTEIVSLRLNRPESLNALSSALEASLLVGVRRACDEDEVRVVVFSGAGDNFSAGWDLKEPDVGDPEKRTRAELSGETQWLELLRLLRRPDKIFVAATHGWVAGQALELCVASDIVVAAEDARFYFAETKVGFNMTSGTARLLPLLVGLQQAKRLALTGAIIDAQEAERLGLVVEVVQKGEHEQAARNLSERICESAPLACAAQKMLFDAGIDMSLASAQRAEVVASLRLGATDDFHEARTAFIAKRVPVFRGR
ncbi:MAG: enoyl-CoA hydratase/isomerase family protein [Acidimicrobiales bacterium]